MLVVYAKRKFQKMVITRSYFFGPAAPRESMSIICNIIYSWKRISAPAPRRSFQKRASTTSRRRWRFLWASLQKWWCARWEMPPRCASSAARRTRRRAFWPKKNKAATVYARVCNYAYEKCALRKGEERAAVSDRIAFEESPIYGLMLFARIKIFPPLCVSRPQKLWGIFMNAYYHLIDESNTKQHTHSSRKHADACAVFILWMRERIIASAQLFCANIIYLL